MQFKTWNKIDAILNKIVSSSNTKDTSNIMWRINVHKTLILQQLPDQKEWKTDKLFQ
jgi:hypothetical protein